MRRGQGHSHGKEPHTTAVAGKGRGRANSNKIYAKLLANSAFKYDGGTCQPAGSASRTQTNARPSSAPESASQRDIHRKKKKQPVGRRTPRNQTNGISSPAPGRSNLQQNQAKKSSALSQPPAKSNDWRYSHHKEELRKKFADPTSAIHKMGLEEIYNSNPEYMKLYPLRNFKTNVKNLQKKLASSNGYRDRTNDDGSEEEEDDDDTQTNSSPSTIPAANADSSTKKGPKSKKVTKWQDSKAKSLLRSLLIDPSSGIHKKHIKDIYASRLIFQDYPFDRFQANHKTLTATIEESRLLAVQETDAFEREQALFPRNKLTSRGYPFWHLHDAKELLEQDVKSGVANEHKPSALRILRAEYQEFPIQVFCAHVHQEKRKQREKTYWQQASRLIGRRKHEEEVQKMKEQWCEEQSNYDSLLQNFAEIGFND